MIHRNQPSRQSSHINNSYIPSTTPVNESNWSPIMINNNANQINSSNVNHIRHHSLNSINMSQLMVSSQTQSSSSHLKWPNETCNIQHNNRHNNYQQQSSYLSNKTASFNMTNGAMESCKHFDPELMAIAIYNFQPNCNLDSSSNACQDSSSGSSKRSSTTSSSLLSNVNCDSISISSSISLNNSSMRHNHPQSSTSTSSTNYKTSNSKYLPIFVGDVLIIMERYGQWYRGFREHDSSKIGLFPMNYVQVFDDDRSIRHQSQDNGECGWSYYYYTLLDPLYLQVVRTLREWHHHLVSHYTTNVNMDKFLIVRNLIYELLELCSTLNKDLAPSLWRCKRSSSHALLKINSSDLKDPFAKLYVGEEDDNGGHLDLTDNKDRFDSTSSSAISETSLEDLYERILSKLNQGNQHLNLDIMPGFTYATLTANRKPAFNMQDVISLRDGTIKKRTKLQAFYLKDNCKYLPQILDYYNHINRGFLQKFKSNISASSTMTTSGHRHSISVGTISPTANTSTSRVSSSSSIIRKYRRHLLLMIKDANFGNDTGCEQSMQIDFYIIRCCDSSSSNHSSSSSSNIVSGSGSMLDSMQHTPYEVLTEKYCFRVNGQRMNTSQQQANRALFLDVLSKRSQSGGVSGHQFPVSGFQQSQQSDSSNYYLVIQVWRNGKILLNESRHKTMLHSSHSSTGSSVFHTISTAGSSISSISSSAVVAANSLSSITSFVSNSSLFNNNSDKSTSNSSSTPDSSSIDSSEFRASHFKRSVGFSVIPLLELVSQDKEIRPSPELFHNDQFLAKMLFCDESKLFPFSVKLYEGDLTVSVLESMLKHRQSSILNQSSSTSGSSSSAISKQSPLAPNSYQLVICAKFISELIVHNNNSNLPTDKHSPATGNAAMFVPPLSLADHLLMNGTMGQQLVNGSTTITANNKQTFSSTGNGFVLVQKRCFGDLITAGHFRNDFYLTLESAEFEKGGKTIPKNIEVSVCLITENGLQERAIQSGVNMEPVTFYRSHIQYHQNSPKWFEHIKINVPLEQFETAHLRFTFCHCSSKERERKFLGFSYLPLADQQGACLPDGLHELHVYKCDSERKLDDVCYYLCVPWGPNQKPSMVSQSNNSGTLLINSRSNKELFLVRSTLISSKLTQNSDILSLLKWSCTPLPQVYESLQRLSRVPGEEMVKFLEDILDALFALFTTTSTTTTNPGSIDQQQIIFRVIVDFFKTLNDPKFISYRSALEKYIEKQFSAPLVYQGLIDCLKKYMHMVIVSVQNETNSNVVSGSGVTKRDLEFILRCLSVFDWMLKIIVQSRILYTRAVSNGSLVLLDTEPDNQKALQTDEQFKHDLQTLFACIQRLLSVDCKSSDDYLIVAIQESVLNSIPLAFTYLAQMLRPLEMAKLVQSLVYFQNGQPTQAPPPAPYNSQHRHSIHNDFSPLSASSSSVTPTNCSTPTSCWTSKKSIVNAKLTLLQHSIQYAYIWQDDQDARLELLDIYIRLLNICLSDSKHCLNILKDIVNYLIDNAPIRKCFQVQRSSGVNENDWHSKQREIEMLSFGAIDAIVEHIIELTGLVPSSFADLLAPFNLKMNHGLGNGNSLTPASGDYLGTLIICLMVIMDYMSLKHYEKLFEKRSHSHCKELMLNIFAVLLNALHYFPENWLEMKMSVNRIMLHSMKMLRCIMSSKFLGLDRFDETVWRMYFKLAIAFLTQPRLQLESQTHWKRALLLQVYGCDMRILMGFELVQCWQIIGPFKIHFIPGLVSSFVDVTLVPEYELRKATIPIFYDMLMVDFMANGNFKQVQASLIDKLDVVSHKTECDLQFKQLFTQILTDKIETGNPVWSVEGLKLVQCISQLLALLIDYRNELKRKLVSGAGLSAVSTSNKSSLANQNCEVDDRLLICTYTILKFYRDDLDSGTTNRKAIMLRYLEKLANVHTLLGNYAEAAFTLKLESDQLSWSNVPETQKKETLCQTMLDYFDKGQCWEEGIKVCKDLQQLYERSYQYSKLSAMLKRNAGLLDKILTQQRPDNEYFRVSFYGMDFPSFLQNSTFIFRGLEFEKISSFTQRIQQQFPNAQLLTKVIPSDENITEAKCQYIQIFSVKPIPEPPILPDQMLSTMDNVLSYYNTNSVRQFTQDRPIQRGPFDPNNEFKSLWIERTTFVTEQALPGMLRMFKVVSSLVTYLSPIENACETIQNKNGELSKLISIYQNENTRPESISPLTMRLQGILDAAVNGGIAKYIDAFLGSEFLTANPDQVANVSKLKDRIAHEIQIVETGLTLHGHLAPTAVRPLHTRLLERFAMMRNTVHQANIETSQALLWNSNSGNVQQHRPSILSQPLPPIPSSQHQQHRHNHHDHISDPSTSSDTSSICSASSSQMNMFNNVHQGERSTLMKTPPPLFAFGGGHQSPGSKCSLKNKPLPPLPMANNNHVAQHQAVKRHNSNIENRCCRMLPRSLEDSIYSVPQYSDLNDLNNHLLDNESSVDDSMDYCDVQHYPKDDNIIHNNNNRMNRSLSIPCSSMVMHCNPVVVKDDDAPALPPPPLPPRSSGSTLDRSNSFNNNHNKAPLTPPALPERPIRSNKQSCNVSSSSTVTNNTTTSHFTPLDGLEFENLLLSSPTPISTQSSNRPAPIIGIEINNNAADVDHGAPTDQQQSQPTVSIRSETRDVQTTKCSVARNLCDELECHTNNNNNNSFEDDQTSPNNNNHALTTTPLPPTNPSPATIAASSLLLD